MLDVVYVLKRLSFAFSWCSIKPHRFVNIQLTGFRGLVSQLSNDLMPLTNAVVVSSSPVHAGFFLQPYVGRVVVAAVYKR